MFSPMMMQLKIAVKTGIKLLYMLAFDAPNLLNVNAHNVYETELAKTPNDNNGTIYLPISMICDGVTFSMMKNIGMK